MFDPCCGSGGMFVQSEKFVLAHGGRVGDIAIYGQESNFTTWRLAKMNLAIRGIDANLGGQQADSFHIVEADLVDCMIAMPGQLFYTTGIPVCLWFVTRSKKNRRFRGRRKETLFIDARKLGHLGRGLMV